MADKRKFLRIKSQPEPCTVVVDQTNITGTIVDESISGAKIIGLDLMMMPFNKKLSLQYREENISVHARNTMRDEDGKFVLGVVRSEVLDAEQQADSSAMLINCYVKHGGACVICVPLQIESDSTVVIQLWDGVQFRVPRSQLFPMSRLERFEMLEDTTCLAYTTAMYGFENISIDFDRRQVFEYEFGNFDNCPVSQLALNAV